MPLTISVLVAFALGSLLGSFLNVCVARIPAGESVVAPRSRCLACGNAIRWYDNLPLISFCLLRGRCRDCGGRIAVRYPLVELALGAWFAVAALPLTHSNLAGDAAVRVWVHQLSLCALGFFLIGLMLIDWTHYRLPDLLTITGILLGLLFVCTDAVFLGPNDYNLVLQRRININSANAGRSTGNVFLTGPEHLLFGRMLAVVVCFLVLFAIGAIYKALRHREGMGLGDAKLLAMIASFIGFGPAVLAFFCGTLLATAYGFLLLMRNRANALTRLPFGSFLCVGGLASAVLGTRVLDWYLHLFR